MAPHSCIEQVLATEELAHRPQRAPDYAAESRAMAALARQMADDPHGVPQRLAELVLELCGADSAGISLLEQEDGRPVFRWRAIAGVFASGAGGSIPYDSSPCAPVVERNELMLLRDVGRCFPSLRKLDPPLLETMLAPWRAADRAVGTVWAISHRPGRQFDAEDARVLQSLAGFAAAAWQSISLERDLVGEQVRAAEEKLAALAAHNAALRASESRFRTLADTVPMLIWQSDESVNNLFVNRYFLDFTGRRLEELEGDGWQSLLHPDDVAPYIAGCERAVRARSPWRGAVRVRRHDGQWRWFDSHGKPLFAPGGRYTGHVGAALDVTETVLAEQALKETDRRKDEFLAVLAHELRNPLAPISNAVHLLRHPDGRRRADRIVEMMGRQVRQIVKLVDDLLEISRITRAKIELHLQPVLLADAVHGAIETSRPLIDGGHHHLAVELPSAPVLLHADGVRLTQVLANLLNNAAKYTDPGGRIVLRAQAEDGQVAIAVCDDGIGIPAAELPHVFDMFTQAHRAHGRGQGGLGIGLAMVKSLVQLHGGTVQARSGGPGQGSEFVVRLPLAAGAAPRPDAGAGRAAALPLAGRRVLVVDDNCDAADTLVMLLEADGAEARAVYDGAAALALLSAFFPAGGAARPGHARHGRLRRGAPHPRAGRRPARAHRRADGLGPGKRPRPHARSRLRFPPDQAGGPAGAAGVARPSVNPDCCACNTIHRTVKISLHLNKITCDNVISATV